jgi:chromosome segregation ATPase
MSEIDPYEREAAKAAIKTLRRELAEAQDKIEELVEIGLTQMDKERSLKRELAGAKDKIEQQVTRIKYLEGATNHATGTPLTKALEQLHEMKIDRDEWKEVAGGRLLDKIYKVAQLERELAEARKQRDTLAEAIKAWIRKSWQNCRCDHGHDGRMQLRGEKCEKCKLWDAVEQALAAVKGGTP